MHWESVLGAVFIVAYFGLLISLINSPTPRN